jgi:hypothetical protein
MFEAPADIELGGLTYLSAFRQLPRESQCALTEVCPYQITRSSVSHQVWPTPVEYVFIVSLGRAVFVDNWER